MEVADDCERAVPGARWLRVRYAAGAVARMQVTRPRVVVIDGTLRPWEVERVVDGARGVGAEVVLAAKLGADLAAAVQSALATTEQKSTRPPSYWSQRPDTIIDKLTLPDGPFALTLESVDEHVAPGRLGVYVLLQVEEGSADLVVVRVGRSDTDLNRRLKAYLSDPVYQLDERYELVTHFSFGFLETPQAAFETECVLFHDWQPALNEHHPGCPRGSEGRCPVRDEDACPPLADEQ